MSIDALDRQLIADDIHAYLKQHEEKDLLRFITCGSVDDGKSTLIGRLLFDSKMIFEDHLAAIEAASAHHGTVGNETDLALLTDGLRAEREQGITIDVAYRFFSTQKRKFIIADTPGHEQYTRNMATGASTADLAVILIDARHGILDQTRRHSFISALLGIQHMIIAINKMDLVDYSQDIYEDIKRQFVDFAARLNVSDIHFIPISALVGDNVVHRSQHTPWFQGRPLLSMLEEVHIASDRNYIDFRLPIQSVLRPNLNFRGYQGTVASGAIKVGDKVMAMPSGKTSHIERIVTFDGDQNEAFPPQAVTVTLADEIDLSRGDMLVKPNNVPRSVRHFEAMVVWMHESPLINGRSYLLKIGTQNVPADAAEIRYRVDVNSLKQVDAHTIDGVVGLKLNEVGRVLFEANRNVLFDPYRKNRATGNFIIIDRTTNVTVGAGMILDRRTHDERGQERRSLDQKHPLLNAVDSTIKAETRQTRFGHPASTIWLTGLPRSGKSTIAYALESRLWSLGCAVHVLDGVAMRLGLSKDLGFSVDDRSESSRRAAETARILNDAGLMTIAAFVSPYHADRERARMRIGSNKFIQVWLETSISTCEARDSAIYPDGNGIYAQARAGKIKNFTGISAPYEEPVDSDLVVKTDEMSIDEIVDAIVDILDEHALLPKENKPS